MKNNIDCKVDNLDLKILGIISKDVKLYKHISPVTLQNMLNH